MVFSSNPERSTSLMGIQLTYGPSVLDQPVGTYIALDHTWALGSSSVSHLGLPLTKLTISIAHVRKSNFIGAWWFVLIYRTSKADH